MKLTFAFDLYYSELFLALRCEIIEPELYNEILMNDLYMLIFDSSVN